MKVLFIGGTGNISAACSRLALARGIELYHLNRGTREVQIPGVKTIQADIHQAQAEGALTGHSWEVVVNWIAYTAEDVQTDFRLFSGKTKQYIFITVRHRSIKNRPPTRSSPNPPRCSIPIGSIRRTKLPVRIG